MVFKVNDITIVEHKLNSTFGSHDVTVNEGLNKFEFLVNIKAEDAVINTNCIGQFNVAESGAYQPRVILKRTPSAPNKGTVLDCKLIRIS